MSLAEMGSLKLSPVTSEFLFAGVGPSLNIVYDAQEQMHVHIVMKLCREGGPHFR